MYNYFMSTVNYTWNRTTLYYVKCTINRNGISQSFIRPTYAKNPIIACREASQQIIKQQTSDVHFFTVVGERTF